MLRTGRRGKVGVKLLVSMMVGLTAVSCSTTPSLGLLKEAMRAINKHDWQKVYALSSRRVKEWLSQPGYTYYAYQAEQTHNHLEAYIFVPESGLRWERFGCHALVRLPAVRKASGPPSCTMNPAPFEPFKASFLFVREHDGWKLDNILPVDGLELPDLESLLQKTPQRIRAGEVPEIPYFSWWAKAILEAIQNAKFPPKKIADVLTSALLLLNFDLFEKALIILAGKDRNYHLQVGDGIVITSCLGMFRDRRVLSTYLKHLTADFPYLDLCMAHIRSILPEEAPPISDAELLAWLADNLPRLDWDEKSLRFVIRTPVRTPVGSPVQIKEWQVKLRHLSEAIERRQTKH